MNSTQSSLDIYEAPNKFKAQTGDLCAVISSSIQGVLIGEIETIGHGNLTLKVKTHKLPSQIPSQNDTNQNDETLVIPLDEVKNINQIETNRHGYTAT